MDNVYFISKTVIQIPQYVLQYFNVTNQKRNTCSVKVTIFTDYKNNSNVYM